MDAIEAIKTRRSVRTFLPEPVSRQILEDLVDCGRLAATAINIQPWEFVVVTSEAGRKSLSDITDHGKFIVDAPACIVVLCKDSKYYLEDGAAATQNILVAARAHGLGACWIAGDKKPYADDIRQTLGAPDGYKVISLIAIGKPAQDPHPGKRTLSQVMHWERF
jgi:nitroreductase